MTRDQAQTLSRVLERHRVPHLVVASPPMVPNPQTGEPEMLPGALEHNVVIADVRDFNVTDLVWDLAVHGFGLRFEPGAPGCRLMPIAPTPQLPGVEEVDEDDIDFVPPADDLRRCASCRIPLAVTGGRHAPGCPADSPAGPDPLPPQRSTPRGVTWTFND